VRRWKLPAELVVAKKMMWRHIPGRVRAIRGSELIVERETARSWRVPPSTDGVMEPTLRHLLLNGLCLLRPDVRVENAYELLTDPGEWFLDPREGVIFLKPPSAMGFGPDSSACYARFPTLMRLEGTARAPIENTTIEGLHFAFSGGSRLGVTAGSPTEPTYAATANPCGALQVNTGRRVTVTGTVFVHIGMDALLFDVCGRDLHIVGNGFGDVSRAAISLSQSTLVVDPQSKRRVLEANEHKFFDNVEIRSNYIRCTGVDDIGSAVVFSEFSRAVRVIHNDIAEVPTCAVRNGWRYFGWRHHVSDIEYAWNRTSCVGQAGMEDYAALYIAGCDDGTARVHHNYVDGAGIRDGNFGIYLDVFCKGASIDHNCLVNMPRKHGALPGFGGWLGLVMSTHTEVHDNWTDSRCMTDISPPSYRYWRSQTNRFWRNQLLNRSPGRLSAAAQATKDAAGLEPEHRSMRERVDSQIEYCTPLRRLWQEL
jgi:hypothetical protein